jgi:hypothetical protein
VTCTEKESAEKIISFFPALYLLCGHRSSSISYGLSLIKHQRREVDGASGRDICRSGGEQKEVLMMTLLLILVSVDILPNTIQYH